MRGKKAKSFGSNFPFFPNRKKGDFDFEWIFAILAGIAILILAIYGASRVGDTMRYQRDTETGKQISILADPLQAGFATSSLGRIKFKQEAKILNECYEEGFGKNDISVALRSGVGKPWNEPGGATSIHNKYIFSDGLSGKEFLVFSTPFNFPFKTADMIFITTKGYCFIDAPEEIEEVLRGFNAPNIRIQNCSNEDIEVCFGKRCNISVYGTCSGCDSQYEEGYVEKNGARMSFAGNLMYAAFFSSKQVYDCNVKRLLYRTSRVAEVFAAKVDLMNSRNLGSGLKPDLLTFASMTSDASSGEIISLSAATREIKLKNEVEGERLW
jgi:hypothetical protein